MGAETKENVPAVRQANLLAKSAQQMELNEKRLIFLAMSHIRWDDDEFLTCELPIKEIEDWFGGNPYQEVKRTADNLLHRVVEIKGEQGRYRKFQWTTLSEYIPATQHPEGVSIIRLRFNIELRPHLLLLKEHFNSIPLEPLLLLPSFNAQRLYEVLWHDSHGGKKTFLTYVIADLKTYLGLRDPSGKWEKYDEWRDFRRLLQRLQKAIEPIGPLRIVRFKGLKQNSRSFNQIRFEIALDAGATSPIAPPNVERRADAAAEDTPPKWLELAGDLREAGYNQDPLEAITRYGFETVQKTLKRARKAERDAATTRKPIRNLGGLIARMLRDGVGQQYTEQKREAPADISAQVQAIKDAYSASRNSAAQALWDQFGAGAQEEVIAVMRTTLNPTQTNVLNKATQEDPAFRAILHGYLLESYPDELPVELTDLQSFAEANGYFDKVSHAERQRLSTALAHED